MFLAVKGGSEREFRVCVGTNLENQERESGEDEEKMKTRGTMSERGETWSVLGVGF